MGVQHYLQPVFVSSTYRTLGYRDATLSAAYVSKLLLENYWVTLHLKVSNLECNQSLLALHAGLLGHIKLTSALSYVQPYGCNSSSAVYVCKFKQLNKWFPLNLWISNLRAAKVCKLYQQYNWPTPHICLCNFNCSLY